MTRLSQSLLFLLSHGPHSTFALPVACPFAPLVRPSPSAGIFVFVQVSFSAESRRLLPHCLAPCPPCSFCFASHLPRDALVHVLKKCNWERWFRKGRREGKKKQGRDGGRENLRECSLSGHSLGTRRLHGTSSNKLPAQYIFNARGSCTLSFSHWSP